MIELKDGSLLSETQAGPTVFRYLMGVPFILMDAPYSRVVMEEGFYQRFRDYLFENITEANEKAVMEVIEKIDKQFWEATTSD